MLYSAIAGTGSYNPLYMILENKDLEKMVNTNDEWITKMTGIKTRCIAGPDETNATMGWEASKEAHKDANVKPEELEMIIVATNTNEYPIPACGGEIQDRLGAKCGFKDLQAGCSAFSYALADADCAIRAGLYKTVLVVGTDALSRITNWKERETCVLFGDGASAMVLKRSDEPGILNHYLGGRGNQRHALRSTSPDIERLTQRKEGKQFDIYVPGKKPIYTTGQGYLYMEGKKVFKFATDVMPEACINVLKPNDFMDKEFTLNDVNWIIPHNANLRIIESAIDVLARRTNIDREVLRKKFFYTIEQYGNVSTASYPNSFHEAIKRDLIKDGDLIILVGFGAGLTYGANLIRYRKLKLSA